MKFTKSTALSAFSHIIDLRSAFESNSSLYQVMYDGECNIASMSCDHLFNCGGTLNYNGDKLWWSKDNTRLYIILNLDQDYRFYITISDGNPANIIDVFYITNEERIRCLSYTLLPEQIM